MKKEKSQDELLRQQNLRAYNKAYYQKHKKAIIQRVLKSRKNTSELTKARWNLNYWSNKVKKLEQLENEGKNEGTNISFNSLESINQIEEELRAIE